MIRKHTCVKLSTDMVVISLYIKYILCSHFLIRSLSRHEMFTDDADSLREENRSKDSTMQRINILESTTFDVIVDTNVSN